MKDQDRVFFRPIVGLVFLTIVILAAGAYYDWGQAGLVLLTGCWLFLAPPQRAPHRYVNVGVLILFIWGLLQLVPTLGVDGGWRSSVLEEGVILASSIAPQRQLQIENLLLVFVGIALLYLYTDLNQRVHRNERRLLLIIFSVITGILVFTCFWLTRQGIHNPLAPSVHLFSFMPNRNQMSIIGAMGGMVAFALSFERIARHPIQGLVLLVVCALNFMGLSSLHSRAGVILFVLGCTGWIIFSWHRQTLPIRFKSIAPFVLLLVAIFFLMGDVATNRIFGFFNGTETNAGMIGRSEIWKDALRMALINGWTGIGWGEFPYLFSHFRDLSSSPERILHPESDLLWAWIELGIPGLIGVFLILYGLFKAVMSGDHGVDRFRKIAGASVLILLLHGFVDVSLHRYGTFLVGVWLCGMAMRSDSDRSDRALWLSPPLWRGIGALLFLGGLYLGWSVWHRQPVMSQTVFTEGVNGFSVEYKESGRYPLGTDWLEKAITRFPLEWSPYSMMAFHELSAGDLVGARDLFRKARVVEKKMGVIAMAEGKAWASILPSYAIVAYQSAFFEREMYLREAEFIRIYAESEKNLLLNQGLARLARADPEMHRIVLTRFKGKVSQAELKREFKEDPQLSKWPVGDQERLYLKYGRNFGWESVLSLLEPEEAGRDHPLVYAYVIGETGQWDMANRLFKEKLKEEPESTYEIGEEIHQLIARLRRSPKDLASLMALVRECRIAGDLERAEAVMEDYRKTGARQTKEYLYWYARTLTDLGKSKKAWETWRSYLDLIQKEGGSWGDERELPLNP